MLSGSRDNSGTRGLKRSAPHRGQNGVRPELSPVKEQPSLTLVKTGRSLVFCVLDHVCVSSCSTTATGWPCLMLMFCETVIWTGGYHSQVTAPGQQTDVRHHSVLSQRCDRLVFMVEIWPREKQTQPDQLGRMSESPRHSLSWLSFLPPYSGCAQLAVSGLYLGQSKTLPCWFLLNSFIEL